jgi:hypothetical protein
MSFSHVAPPRTAHDVRHLVHCASCLEFGDRRKMLKFEGQIRYFHGACVVKILSEAAILALPKFEREKFTLADTGPDLMRKLLLAADTHNLNFGAPKAHCAKDHR